MKDTDLPINHLNKLESYLHFSSAEHKKKKEKMKAVLSAFLSPRTMTAPNVTQVPEKFYHRYIPNLQNKINPNSSNQNYVVLLRSTTPSQVSGSLVECQLASQIMYS